MLKTRVITAVVLLAGILPLLFLASTQSLYFIFSVIVSVAGWEWFRLLWGVKSKLPWLFSLTLWVILVLTLILLQVDEYKKTTQVFLYLVMGLSSFFWLFIVPFMMKKSLNFSLSRFSNILSLTGFIVFTADWYAILVLREKGLWVLLSVFLLVWIADIGAYFFGKKFGKHKLAPFLSPGKSIEGVIGGMFLVTLLGFLFYWFGDGVSNFFDIIGSKLSIFTLPFIMIFLCGMSVIGDLFESQLKRLQGLKDSSNLLPGHGGVLDRIDALMPVLPIAALLLLGLS
jgi:phosphatidate cytidylyltransferase